MDSAEYKNMEYPPLTNQVADNSGMEVEEQEIEKDEDSPTAEVMNEEREDTTSTPKRYPDQTIEEKMEMDSRSIYIGNIDYSATAEELEHYFSACGTVNRVVILKDKFSGHPKGFAFLEFADKDSVASSLALDSSVFCGRQIKVMQKRTNTPGISTTNRPPRGGGGRFRRPPQRFFDNRGYQPFGRRA